VISNSIPISSSKMVISIGEVLFVGRNPLFRSLAAAWTGYRSSSEAVIYWHPMASWWDDGNVVIGPPTLGYLWLIYEAVVQSTLDGCGSSSWFK
jgi:hypothetical protein